MFEATTAFCAYTAGDECDVFQSRIMVWCQGFQPQALDISEGIGVGRVLTADLDAWQVTNVLYFMVVSVCAPIWEEAIFRGFLLPSLAKWMPISGAVLASSLIFAAAHFSLQRFAPLLLLGIIMGTLFVRSRNLLTSVALHSLWNMWVFWQVCCRTGLVA